MNWMTALLALIPTVLLVVQGVSCLSRTGAPLYVRRFGVLCGILAGVSFVLGILLASDTLVLSAEFSIVMGHGPWARVGIALLLMGSALASAMGLHVCYLETGRPTRLPWVLSLGAMVGFLAAIPLVSPLNGGDTTQFHIYAYDLWWPPLLIYVSVCLAESALSIVGLHRLSVRLWLMTALIGVLASLASSQPQFDDSAGADLWMSCLFLLPVIISIIVWLSFRNPSQPMSRVQGWIGQGLAVLPVVVGLCSGIAWMWGFSLPDIMTSWSWLLWLSWPLLVALVIPQHFSHAWQPDRHHGQLLPRPTFLQSMVLMVIGVVALSLMALVSLVSLDGTIVLAGLGMTWVFLVEAMAGGPLGALLQRSIRWQQWSDLGPHVSSIGKRLGSWLASLLSVPSMPVLLGKALIGMAILAALSELPNAGKTLIQPFRVLGLPERAELGKDGEEREEVGKAILEQVVNNLGLLQQELRQEVILSLQPDSEGEGGGKKFELMSVGDSTNVNAALGKSPDLEIGGVKIPLGLLFTPVQGPIRRLLGVRAINASVQFDQHGYSLLASSDTGETWKLTVPPNDPASRPVLASPDTGEICKPTESPPASPNNANSKPVPIFPTKSPPASPNNANSKPVPISPKGIARLADELAFHIIKSDAMFAPTLTKSWTAFCPFREGLREWRKFETHQDYGALPVAIAHFRAAIQADPGFAFAHYRLGLALQKDGQPGMAVKAFRASLKADPSLIPAHIALASTLYDFERTSYLSEVGLPLDFLAKVPPQDERIEKARNLWLEVLRMPGRVNSVANLGSAYYGLCRQAYRQGLRQARQEDSGPNARPDDKTGHQVGSPFPWGRHADPHEHRSDQASDMTSAARYRMAYYYCKRAEVLYGSLAAAQQTNPEVKKGEAYVLNTLGNILINSQPLQLNAKVNEYPWKCWTDTVRRRPSRESLKYYMRALEALPDDYRLHCYAARAAYALDKRSRLMERLEADASAHLNLANAHRRLGRVCAAFEQLQSSEGGRLEHATYSRYERFCRPEKAEHAPPKSKYHYQEALHEYYEVLRRDPMNVEALTGYALAVWERLTHTGHSPELRAWVEYYAIQALSHARKASALLSNSPDDVMLPVIRSTLGKAFFAQGSSKWAVDELKEVADKVPNHPAFHEIRWILAQAYLCEASTAKAEGGYPEYVESSEKKAVKLLGVIREQERTREFQLYGDRPGVHGSPWGTLICNPSMGVEIMTDPPFTWNAALPSDGIGQAIGAAVSKPSRLLRD